MAACGTTVDGACWSSIWRHLDQGPFEAVPELLDRGRDSASGWRPYETEVDAWRAMIDPAWIPQFGALNSLGFFCGEEPNIPPACFTLVAPVSSATDGGTVLRVAPTGPPRRLARRAHRWLAWLEPDLALRLEDSGRTGLALATAAVRPGEVATREVFFRQVYGFSYSKELHKNAFTTLVHRMRTEAEGVGRILNTSAGVEFVVDRAALIAEPQFAPSLGQSLAALLATEELSTRDAAQSLSLTERSIQRELRQLLEEGAVVAERRGRSLVYRLEDTTFKEPTHWLRRNG